MDVRLVIKQRLEELGLEQRDLAAAAQVTESYISQLLNRKKAPPAVDRTDLYERINTFLKFPKGRLSTLVAAQRAEELKKKLVVQPAALFKEVRELVIRKCKADKQSAVRDIFEKQAFGELERLVTQKLLDVTKKISREELQNESWLRSVARLRQSSYEEIRVAILEFLDIDVFNISPEHFRRFLGPMIESWDVDLKTLAIEIELNRRLAPVEFVRIQFTEIRSDQLPGEEPGLLAFLRDSAMSGDATAPEIEFLKSLRFGEARPTPLYFYRELQNLRDPLHFSGAIADGIHRRRDSGKADKQRQLSSRKKAINRWARNKPASSGKNAPKSP
ncbi:MAG TPA: helix-turn-helix transcriptional regulator [Candidatus Acidoferrum sp.]|nr:helix-turn-helix transcriptional regulator [Candidatus Acidoferrum sp.]